MQGSCRKLASAMTLEEEEKIAGLFPALHHLTHYIIAKLKSIVEFQRNGCSYFYLFPYIHVGILFYWKYFLFFALLLSRGS